MLRIKILKLKCINKQLSWIKEEMSAINAALDRYAPTNSLTLFYYDIRVKLLIAYFNRVERQYNRVKSYLISVMNNLKLQHVLHLVNRKNPE